MWLVRGCGKWTVAHQEPLLLHPGTIILTRPGTIQHIRWDERQHTRYGWAAFDLLGRRGRSGFGSRPTPLVVPAEPPVRGLLDYLEWLGTWRPAGWSERAADVISLVVSMCTAGPLRHANEEPDPPEVLRVAIDHVQHAWADGQLRAVRLAELAAASSVSTGHFARSFHRHFGIGAADALERLRLSHAAELVLHSPTPLAEIAAQCGFADAYHFSRRFSARYGIPPGRCRRGGLPIDILTPLTESRLLGLAARVWPSGPIEQAANTSAPPPLGPRQTYGQTFTVPPGLFLTNVSFLLATYRSGHSGVTVTLFKGQPGGQRDRIAGRQIKRMIDNTTEWLHFPAQPAGTYYIELSAPHGTPTWWWHQGRDAARVGGNAFIDHGAVPHTNFIFSANAVRGGSQ